MVDEIRGILIPRLWLSYAITATSIAALMAIFSYLGAFLVEATMLPQGWVPLVLLLYGIGAMVGIVVGGRTADARPVVTAVLGFGGLLVIALLLAVAATHALPVAILVLLLGFAGFSTNPMLNSRVFGIAPAAPTLAAAGNVAAFNVGISGGTWLGGLILTSRSSYPGIALISAALAAIALCLLAADVLWSRVRPVPQHRTNTGAHCEVGG